MSTTMSGRDYLIKSFRTEISCTMSGLYLKGQGPATGHRLDHLSGKVCFNV